MSATAAVSQVVDAILKLEGCYQATKFISEKETVKATLRRHKKKIRKNGHKEILLTIGKPNYREREFIKTRKKVGEPFPVKKVILKRVK